MKNQKNSTPLFSCPVKLSGVVTYDHSQDCGAVEWKKKLISSFTQARFRNVLCRATVLPRVNWFWHSQPNSQFASRNSQLNQWSLVHTTDLTALKLKISVLAPTLNEAIGNYVPNCELRTALAVAGRLAHCELVFPQHPVDNWRKIC